MKLAMYLRKSRSDPDSESVEQTLSRHKKTLLNFAKINKLNIIDIYEEVVSGDGLFVRPQMMQMMANIEGGKYDGVLCVDIDRLGRVDTKDRGIILETFKNNNTKIITPRKIYDLNDDIDEFSTEIEMLIARQELKKITQRLQAGIKRTAEDGFHVCEPPLGYRRAYLNKRPTLEIVEDEAKIVRTAFDMYVNHGAGDYLIADNLNAMGFRTKSGAKFTRSSIYSMLRNYTYAGMIVYNQYKHIKRKRPEDKHHYVLNPQDEWIVTKGMHPAIIDEDMFFKAKKIRETRSHPPTNIGILQNPLAGVIRCANCGALMSRQTSKKSGPRLLCHKNACNMSTTIEKVEKAVYNSLQESLEKFKLSIHAPEDEKIKKDIDDITDKINNIKKQINVLETQKDNLHDLLEQGVYDIPTFTERGTKITGNISCLKKMLEGWKTKLNEINTAPAYKEIMPTLQKLVNNYFNLEIGEKNRLLKKIIDSIYYKRDRTMGSEFEISIVFKKWI